MHMQVQTYSESKENAYEQMQMFPVYQLLASTFSKLSLLQEYVLSPKVYFNNSGMLKQIMWNIRIHMTKISLVSLTAHEGVILLFYRDVSKNYGSFISFRFFANCKNAKVIEIS